MMKAIILAGGKGKRLRPLTCHLPKPMLPIMEKPVLHYLMERLSYSGIIDVAVTVEYMAQAIKDYFQDGGDLGLTITYFEEQTPLGTAGAVNCTKRYCDKTFLVLSGDVLTDVNFNKAIQFHQSHDGIATVLAKKVSEPQEYGVLTVDDNKQIIDFKEKPRKVNSSESLINTGMYIFDSEIFEYLKTGACKDISRDLLPRLLRSNEKFYAYEFEEYWIDIGNVSQFRQVHEDILLQKVIINIPGSYDQESQVWLGKDIWIEDGATIQGPAYIGDRAIVRSGVKVKPLSVIGAHTEIQQGASVKRSIIWHNSYIGHKAELRGAIIAEKNVLLEGVSVFEDCLIGSSSTLGVNVTVKPGVKVWPLKKIQNESVLDSSLLWGGHHSPVLFTDNRIEGKANINITPELVVTLAGAYIQMLELGDEVAVGSDQHSYTELLKVVFMNTIRSGGIHVLEGVHLVKPMFSILIASKQCRKFGIYFEMIQDSVVISCYNKDGEPLDSKAQYEIERALKQRSFRHLPWERIGSHRTLHLKRQPVSLRGLKPDGRFFIYERPCVEEAWENLKKALHKECLFEVSLDGKAASIRLHLCGWVYLSYSYANELVVIYSDVKAPSLFINYVNEKIKQYQRV